MSGTPAGAEAKRMGQDAHGSAWLDHAARAGLVAYGVVHLTIAWLALQLALGDRSGSASSQGAVKQLAQQPFGTALVWLVAVGMLLLIVWQLLEAAVGHRDEDGADRVRKRLTSVGKAVVYAVLGWSAVKVASGSGSGSSGGGGGTDSMTARLMDLPAGQVLVGLVGFGVLCVGGYMLGKAWTESFRKNLDAEGTSGETGRVYLWCGKLGYAAKGIAIGIVGVLFGYAAVTHRPQESGGMDVALHKVLEQPFGPVLLGVVAVGIGCYGLFCFARARHLSR